MSSRHIITQLWHFGFMQYHFFCILKNDIALGASASSSTFCNIIFQGAMKIDIALNQVPYLYNIVSKGKLIWGDKDHLPR